MRCNVNRPRQAAICATLIALTLAALPPKAAAQSRRRYGSAGPTAWASFWAGFVQPTTVQDGTTGSTWQFGTAPQLGVSLEKNIQSNSSLGVRATFSRAPVTYTGSSFDNFGTFCSSSCDADANITSVQGLFHYGGGAGFHQVIELALGGTAFSNFTARDGEGPIGPSGADLDLSFGLGYGFGWGLSPTTDLEVVEELGADYHPSSNLSASANTLPRFYTTRIGLRVGLGQ